MKIFVRDLAPVVAAIKELNAPILTTSRAPVTAVTPLGKITGIFFRDPDGYIVQAVQQASVPADAPASGNLIGAMMGVCDRRGPRHGPEVQGTRQSPDMRIATATRHGCGVAARDGA